MMELWDLYDENRNALHQTYPRRIPLPEGTYHLVADIWTVNQEQKFLITQRHPDKHHGLLWECTGGAVQAGEDSITGAVRELKEEVGISAQPSQLMLINSMRIPDRFVDTYFTCQPITLSDLTLQPEEVVDARFVTFSELFALWKSGQLVPRERFRLYHKRLEELAASVSLLWWKQLPQQKVNFSANQ